MGTTTIMSHSGDRITGQEGTHQVAINLREIPPNANRIFFTLSAWQGAKFKDIKGADMQLVDPVTKFSLCKYDVAKALKRYPEASCLLLAELIKHEQQWIYRTLEVQGDGDLTRLDTLLSSCRKAWKPLVLEEENKEDERGREKSVTSFGNTLEIKVD